VPCDEPGDQIRQRGEGLDDDSFDADYRRSRVANAAA
jgi:hypothetical protein